MGSLFVWERLRSLSNRSQLTKITKRDPKNKLEIEYISKIRAVNAGVPQGSVLGPLLFILYINDLPKAIDDQMVLFADDSTAVFVGHEDYIDFNLYINDKFNKIISWLNCNDLVINISKTKSMTFKIPRINNKYDVTISYNNETVERVCTTKFLGLQIDDDMSWTTQLLAVTKKLNKYSYALYMLTKIVNRKAVLTAYHAYVVSTLRYAIIFWGNATNVEMVLKGQKKCIRAICNLRFRDSCREYFKKLNVLTVTCIYILEVVLFIRKNTELFINVESERRKYQIQAFPCRTNYLSKSIFGMASKIYNHLPKKLLVIEDIMVFKREINKLLLSKTYYSVAEFFADKFTEFSDFR